ncbi:hypothetical protein FB645_002844 [Coemansia sp. IMI 203386]|nr:hypothetical protein FB645_002844 [Coemansia sp. IMI 203386]
MSKCPKCSRRVESFAVDTNCSFRMCSNVSCTWPFESTNMGQYFEYDAAVPSIRKRAKKRKAHKDEGRKLKKPKTVTPALAEAAVSHVVRSSVAVNKVPSGAENAAQISSWLSDLCDSNIKSRATLLDSSQRPSLVDNLEFPVSGNYQTTGGEILGDNKSLGDCKKPDIDLDSAWINSLLGTSSSDISILKSNGLNSTDLLSDTAVASAASDTVNHHTSCLLNDNVADIFAVLGHGITPAVPSRDGSIGNNSGDAGVPRNSRQNSPAVSNSESGADDIDHPLLSADDLAMIIGGTSKPHASAQISTAATAPLDTSGLFDPISMLLSPPNSAAVAATDGSVSQPDSALDLFSQYYWPSQQQQQQQTDKLSMLTSSSLASSSSSVAVATTSTSDGVLGGSCVSTKPLDSDHLSFDLNKLFNVPVVATSAVGNNQSASDMVASLGSSADIIENIFGKTSL